MIISATILAMASTIIAARALSRIAHTAQSKAADKTGGR